LLRTFIEAANGAPWEAALVAGPMLAPEEFKELQELGRQRVKIHSFVPCLPEVFESVDALVCMGGYNTLVEAVCQGVPTVCIPRAWPRREQVLRAQAFERLGLLRSLDSETLGVETLRSEITAALNMPRKQVAERARATLQVDGAQNAADQLAALFSNGRDRGKVVLTGP
jgi:predicted glycosyltransferase